MLLRKCFLIQLTVFIVLYVFSFTACNEVAKPTQQIKAGMFPVNDIDLEQFTEYMKLHLQESDIQLFCKKDTIYDDSLFKAKIVLLYTEIDFKPLWITKKGISMQAENYIKSLDSLIYDGLDPSDYLIDSQLNRYKNKSTNSKLSIVDWMNFELGMTKSFMKVSHDMVLGKYYQLNRSNKNWKNINDTTFDETLVLKKSLSVENISEAYHYMRPQHPWYQAFRNEMMRLSFSDIQAIKDSIRCSPDSLFIGHASANILYIKKKLAFANNEAQTVFSDTCDELMIGSIKKFQYKNQLKETGKIDSTTLMKLNQDNKVIQQKIKVNMERLRWLSHDFKQPYIWANLPQMEVVYENHDSVSFRMRTVIGRPTRATPTLTTQLTTVILSPNWTVPPTILKEDVLPGVIRRGGAYLSRKGLKAYDRKGRVVNANHITRENYKQYSYSQAPGYRSSLGEVKFNMPNPWSIYMHDTPHREDFVKSYRAFSSGCVRVHKPKEFATFLLNDTSKYSYVKVDSICKTRKTIYIPLKKKVDVYFVYLTTALDSAGNMMQLKDVYHWDDKIVGMK